MRNVENGIDSVIMSAVWNFNAFIIYFSYVFDFNLNKFIFRPENLFLNEGLHKFF